MCLNKVKSYFFSVLLLEVGRKGRPSWYRSMTKTVEPQAPFSCSAIFNHGFHSQGHLENQSSSSNPSPLQTRNRRRRDEKKMKHFPFQFPFKHPSQYPRQYLYIHLITKFIQETLYFIHFVTPGHCYIQNKTGSTF